MARHWCAQVHPDDAWHGSYSEEGRTYLSEYLPLGGLPQIGPVLVSCHAKGVGIAVAYSQPDRRGRSG